MPPLISVTFSGRPPDAVQFTPSVEVLSAEFRNIPLPNTIAPPNMRESVWAFQATPSVDVTESWPRFCVSTATNTPLP